MTGRGLGAFVALLAAAACSAAAPPDGPDPEAAKASCAAATAAHVGKPTDAVAAVWTGFTPQDEGIVAVTDVGANAVERTHICTVRADGGLVSLAHSAP